MALSLGHLFLQTILIASWTPTGSKARLVASLTLPATWACQMYLVQSFCPLLLAQILAGNILSPACFCLFYYVCLTNKIDAAVPHSFMKSTWTDLLCVVKNVLCAVRGIPPLRSTRRMLDGPEKVRFGCHLILRFAGNFLIPEVTWLLGRWWFGAGTPEWQRLLAPGTEWLVFGESSRQLQARLVATVGFWLVTYVTVDFLDCFLLAVLVLVDGSVPDTWPPLFGRLEQAYSVRRFWGKFWHQLLHEPLVGSARAIVARMPHWRKKELRVLFTFCVFFLSGVTHGVTDYVYWTTAGVHTLPVLRFFCSCALALVVETIFTGACGITQKKAVVSPWEKSAGYLWVFSFLLYTTPPLVWPTLRVLETENKRLLV
ncbi:hypothetical protein FE257_003075 [Aspergillus nanangensis]|uniref:Wax synthase domain-containing protein n=1 Tax=Aspergillus nanangensis TaxID=2582783 RepID=A0AAD4GNS8_ASPNN|nr:hypothetical protein FE257_003075 [Aspergillus nanangensis]